MRTAAPITRRRRPTASPRLDPYVVRGTWTREELLRARGITPDRTVADDRRPERRAA